jgi:hypothetical protein
MVEHPMQAAAIQRQHPVKELFAGHVDAAMFSARSFFNR